MIDTFEWKVRNVGGEVSIGIQVLFHDLVSESGRNVFSQGLSETL